MAQAQTTELFDCTPEEFFKVVSDYESYPEFLDEVKKCQVIQTNGNKKLVEFTISLVKEFSYRLWLTEEPPYKITWTLESGDFFKVSDGSWALEEEAGKTRATYTLDTQFKVFVPGPIAKGLVNVNLPNMMSSYQKRIKELYGR